VRVVACVGRVLDVCSGDGDTTLSLFGGFVNGAIIEETGKSLFGLTLGNGSCEGCLYETQLSVDDIEFASFSLSLGCPTFP